MSKLNDKTILWAKVKPSAILPTKREEDGWYDIYANFEEKEISFEPFETKLIPTGIASAMTPKWKISLGERGSNTKGNIQLMAGKIDSGYRGEYLVALYNANPIRLVLTKDVERVLIFDNKIHVPYSKAIAQFEISEVPVLDHVEVSYDELLTYTSERGDGKLGSSGK